jgi:hypothetical protein
MQRKVIGDPKAGLSLRIRQTEDIMTLDGRPDPALLIVVITAAVTVGIIGSVATSPGYGVVSFLVFAVLFSPLLTVLLINALRIKTHCELDRPHGTLHIDERSFTRRVQEVYPLEEVAAVIVRRLPPAPLIGGGYTHGLFLELPGADYLASCSNNEAHVGQDAWRISRFLNIPLEVPAEVEGDRPSTQPRILLTTAVVYLAPLLLAVLALVFLADRIPNVEPTMIGLLGAIVISQVGAMLAFAYYRTRRPYEG